MSTYMCPKCGYVAPVQPVRIISFAHPCRKESGKLVTLVERKES